MSYIGIPWITTGENVSDDLKGLSNKIWLKKSSSLCKQLDIQKLKHNIPNKMIQKKSITRHITIKLAEVKERAFSSSIVDLQYHVSFRCTIQRFNIFIDYVAAAAKPLQSCPTLCDPIDGSPPGSPVPGILQARTLEWVAISFSSPWGR